MYIILTTIIIIIIIVIIIIIIIIIIIVIIIYIYVIIRPSISSHAYMHLSYSLPSIASDVLESLQKASVVII